MNIIVAVLERDYGLFTVSKKGKVKCKNYDAPDYYFDIPNKCSKLKVGDAIFFYMYGYCKYYAIVKDIQLKLIPPNECRIFFENIYINNDWQGTRMPKFQGIKYIPDIIYDPDNNKGR
jgi:hypothetical protein